MSWDWQKLLDKGMTGQSLTKGGLPQLLYGEEHPCAFCRGTGQVGGAHQCPVCGGAEKVSIAPPVVWCAFCHGGGHMPLRSDTTCPACRGSGFIGVRPPIQACTKCRGRGRQPDRSLYCGCCGGSGVVTSDDRLVRESLLARAPAGFQSRDAEGRKGFQREWGARWESRTSD